jgi:hypothetical protein
MERKKEEFYLFIQKLKELQKTLLEKLAKDH